VSTVPFNPAHKAVLDDVLPGIPVMVGGMMSGFPAYYINRKLFASIYEEGAGIKVPETVARVAGRPERNCPLPA